MNGLRAFWVKWSGRIDALSLRERLIVFVLAAVVLLVLINSLVLDQQFSRQRQMSEEISSVQAEIDAMRADIQTRISQFENGPDKAAQAKLDALRKEAGVVQARLNDVQKGLVPADRVGSLLSDLVRQNGHLKVVSMTNLPVSGIDEPLPDVQDSKTAGAKTPTKEELLAKAQQLSKLDASPDTLNTSTDQTNAQSAAQGAGKLMGLYRHGVEISVQGDYFELVRYMKSIEALPWRVFWARARLQADDKSQLTLTLTLFTLSLEQKWLNI